ncbi:cysteine desulfurase NifS [Methylomonas sp. Kb3]|uniref:cysteine desulfurase family protein n=1 Tax=Methylomonas sp. Kb3 TaxID=1611544 RepID=UPI000C31EB4E|nr:cysteine desulfurase family protein [Methylomonas sp. Kb3]PKD38238.1 cysteine desulfurase NifS [Methylomonas sp. Kb3]
MENPIVFLDNNSTTRVLPEVIEAMLPYWTEAYFNPASVIGELSGCMYPIYEVKQILCEALNASDPSEFTLTSGATEANNWVLRSILDSETEHRGNTHFIVSAIEHPSILETALAVARHPFIDLTLGAVNSNGVIDIDNIVSLIRPDTRLVSIMLANNETGVIQPVGELAQQIKKKYPECLIHTDATQAIGKIPVELSDELRAVDFLSLSAHKFHGPKGIGALYIRQGRYLKPLLFGGDQQEGRRAGTDNPALAAGMATALRKLTSALVNQFSAIASLRDDMEAQMEKIIPGIQILGRSVKRLPNTTLAIFPTIDGELLVHQLSEHGIAVSTGSACAQGSDRPSHVAIAMGIDYEKARNTLRISLSRHTTEQEINFFLRVLSQMR